MTTLQNSQNHSILRCLVTLCIAILFQTTVARSDDHKHHDHHKHHDNASMVGPNGGKVIHEVHPHVEVFVTKDRKLQITFLSEAGKAISPGKHTVKAICGKRTSPTRMRFTRKGQSFLSGQSLPNGKKIPTVIQIERGAGKKPSIIRLNLNLEK